MELWRIIPPGVAHRAIAGTPSLESRPIVTAKSLDKHSPGSGYCISSYNRICRGLIATRGCHNAESFEDTSMTTPNTSLWDYRTYNFLNRYGNAVRWDGRSFRIHRNSNIVRSPKCLSRSVHNVANLSIPGRERLLGLLHHRRFRAAGISLYITIGWDCWDIITGLAAQSPSRSPGRSHVHRLGVVPSQ